MAADAGEDPVWIQCTTAEAGQCETGDQEDDEASRGYLKPLLVIKPKSFDEILAFMPTNPESSESIRVVSILAHSV